MTARPTIALLGRTAALVVLGAGLGLAANVARPRGALQLGHWAPPASCEGAAEASPLLVSPADAARLCGATGVVLADARTPARFAEGHVAGAIHLPCSADAAAAASGIDRTTGARTVIVYGDSTGEAQAVAATLHRRAPKLDVRVLDGGFPAWASAGLACASGPCDSCTEASHP